MLFFAFSALFRGYYCLTFAPLREIFLRLLMLTLNNSFCRAEPLGLA